MSDITRQKTIDYLYYLKTHYPKNLIIPEYIDYAITSLETDEAYQLEYEQPEFCKDCISREQALRELKESAEHHANDSREEVLLRRDRDIIKALPSVTPQEPQSFKWCTDCKEYDQEKHCCHRYSKVIRDTVEEMKQEYIEREVLDKIRAEIVKKHLSIVEKNGFDSGRTYGYEEVLDIIDKYKAERNDK